VSPSGKAADFDSATRRFESSHPRYEEPFKIFDNLISIPQML
jgi:hypothetical protein